MTVRIGGLMFDLGANTAKVEQDLGKARRIVGREARAMQREATAASNTMTTQFGKFGAAVAGAPGAITAATGALRIFGTQGSAAVQSVGSSMASLLASGITPLSLAITAATVVVGVFAARQGEATEKTDALSAALKRQEERLKSLRSAAEKAELRVRAGGRDVELQRVDEEMARLEQRTKFLRDDLAEATAPGHRRLILADIREIGDEWRSLTQERSLIERRIQSERVLGRTDRKSSAAGFLDPDFTARLDKALGIAPEAEEAPPTVASGAPASPTGPAVTPRVAALRAEVAQIRASLQHRQDALQVLRGWGTEFELELNRARRAFDEASPGTAEPEELRLLGERVGLLRQLVEAERKHTEAKEKGARVDAAATERRDAEKALLEETNKLRFESAQAARTEAEQRVAEAERMYAQLLALARKHGVDTTEFERELAAKLKRIREEGGPSDGRRGATGATPREAENQTRIDRLRQEHAGFAKIGEELAVLGTVGLSDGVAGAIEDIARNSVNAKRAFRDLATSMLWDIARIINRALMMKAALALAGALTASGGGGGGGGTPADFKEGTPSGGGSGPTSGGLQAMSLASLEKEMKRAAALPQAMALASPGAGAGGDIKLAVSVRPPAVIADEVMARSSKTARAEVVATALSRSGKRVARARE